MSSRKNALVFLSWLAVILWMGFIFMLSAQAGDESAELSGGFTEFVGAFMRVFIPNITDETLQVIVRKGAHMFEYALLAILLTNALRQHFDEQRVVYNLALIASLLYAVTDELHQTLIPGRSGRAIDILIDIIGAVVGVVVFKLFTIIFGRSKLNL